MPYFQSTYRHESHCRISLLEIKGGEARAKGVEILKACMYFINVSEGVNFYLTLFFFSFNF